MFLFLRKCCSATLLIEILTTDIFVFSFPMNVHRVCSHFLCCSLADFLRLHSSILKFMWHFTEQYIFYPNTARKRIITWREPDLLEKQSYRIWPYCDWYYFSFVCMYVCVPLCKGWRWWLTVLNFWVKYKTKLICPWHSNDKSIDLILTFIAHSFYWLPIGVQRQKLFSRTLLKKDLLSGTFLLKIQI